jgi:Transposase DDE domain
LLQPRLAANARKRPSERLPEKRVVISVSDPEAALAPDKFKVFRPLYDTLLLIDRQSPLILGYDLFAQSQDTALLVPTLERTRRLTGCLPKRVAVDAGFVTALNLAHCQTLGVELIGPWKENDFSAKRRQPARQFLKDQFVWHPSENAYECPAGQRLTWIGAETRQRAGDQVERLERYRAAPSVCTACALRAGCTTSRGGRQLRRSEHEDLIQAHRAKMATSEAKAILKTRGQVAERGFADLKEHRQLRRHTGRTPTRAKTDVALAVLIHNLSIVHRHLVRKATVTIAGD